MSPQELTAIMLIVNKLGWNDKPAAQTIQIIKQMVNNQISLELDCIGESDDFEETLLSLATWDKEDIASRQFVHDYQSFTDWNYLREAEDAFEQTLPNLQITRLFLEDEFAEDYEWEDAQIAMEEEYYECLARELAWYSHAREMGWE